MNDHILMQWSLQDHVPHGAAAEFIDESGLFFELRAVGVQLVAFEGGMRPKLSYMMVAFDDSFSQAIGRASLGNRLPLDARAVESALAKQGLEGPSLLFEILAGADLALADHGSADFEEAIALCRAASQAVELGKAVVFSESKPKPSL